MCLIQFNRTPKRVLSAIGFTLIEIITVMVIMSITGGLLLVVYNKVRQTGYQASCVGNLKNIGQAMQMYVDDSRLRFPPVSSWYSILYANYLESDPNVFVCPSAPTLSYGATMGYGMNAGLNRAYSAKYDLRNSVVVTELATGGYQILGMTGAAVSNRHRNGANSLCGDGGVTWHLKTWFASRDLTDTY